MSTKANIKTAKTLHAMPPAGKPAGRCTAAASGASGGMY